VQQEVTKEEADEDGTMQKVTRLEYQYEVRAALCSRVAKTSKRPRMTSIATFFGLRETCVQQDHNGLPARPIDWSPLTFC
jgi:hypothetical protein